MIFLQLRVRLGGFSLSLKSQQKTNIYRDILVNIRHIFHICFSFYRIFFFTYICSTGSNIIRITLFQPKPKKKKPEKKEASKGKSAAKSSEEKKDGPTKGSGGEFMFQVCLFIYYTADLEQHAALAEFCTQSKNKMP